MLFTQGRISYSPNCLGSGYRWQVQAVGGDSFLFNDLAQAVKQAPVMFPSVKVWLVNLGGMLDVVLDGASEMTKDELIDLGRQYA